VGEFVSDLMGGLPPGIAERTGRMSAMALRSVIALADKEPDTFAALVERIGSWDDDPGRIPYPLPRYEYPTQEALRIAGDVARTIVKSHVPLLYKEVTEGTAQLVEQFAPAEYRAAVLAKLGAFLAGTPIEISGGEEGGAADFIIAAAEAAWLIGGAGGRIEMQQTIRLTLLKQVRLGESVAIGAPEREQVTEVSDADALALLADLYGENYARVIPGPDKRGSWEWDMLAILKAHLLETPADATTPEQREQLKAKLLALLVVTTAKQMPPLPPQRKPKRKPKRKR
jgi:hypothetical protein